VDEDGNKNPLGWFWRICQNRYQKNAFLSSEMRDLYSVIDRSIVSGMEVTNMDGGGYPIPTLDELEDENMSSCDFQEHVHFDVDNFRDTTLKFVVSQEMLLMSVFVCLCVCGTESSGWGDCCKIRLGNDDVTKSRVSVTSTVDRARIWNVIVSMRR
jgi:hypothetical protein